MKQEYRNSIRSKKLIKETFLKLAAKKDIDKITIKEITDACDLSRNTFYLHYQDVYAVLEESQQETIEHLKEVLDSSKAKNELNEPLPFLEEIAKTIKENRNDYAILMNVKGADEFILKIKKIFMDYVIDSPDVHKFSDPNGFLIFLEILASGTMSLFQICLQEDTDITIDDVVRETNKVYLNGINLYK